MAKEQEIDPFINNLAQGLMTATNWRGSNMSAIAGIK